MHTTNQPQPTAATKYSPKKWQPVQLVSIVVPAVLGSVLVVVWLLSCLRGGGSVKDVPEWGAQILFDGQPSDFVRGVLDGTIYPIFGTIFVSEQSPLIASSFHSHQPTAIAGFAAHESLLYCIHPKPVASFAVVFEC